MRAYPSAVPGELLLSVVVPTLNEGARIERCLDRLAAIPGLEEILVVDGGSGDQTGDIVRAHPHATLVTSPRGRARQMNAGAHRARGHALVFLHADVELPGDAAWWIRSTLAQPGVVAGAFRTWTTDDGDGHRRPSPWLHLADIRSRYARIPYGDQAIFVRREAFDSVGGYPEIALMEDIELSRRLADIGKLRVVPKSVAVSGRRFLAHPLRDTALVNAYPLLYAAGASPDTLARFYRQIR